MSTSSDHFEHTGRPVDLQLGSRPALDVAVLAADVWAFFEHWFLANGHHNSDSHEYWRQAQRFAANLAGESYEAHPLHLYYMILNASKALIVLRQSGPSANFRVHGLSYRLPMPVATGPSDPLPGRLAQETPGVFQALCSAMGDTAADVDLEELVASIPWTHRAWQTSRTGAKERCVTLHGPVRLKPTAGTLYFEAEVAKHAVSALSSAALPSRLLG